jgi:hypothetical protein
MLVQRHNQLFHDKWIAGSSRGDELALGDRDMSSLVDLGNSFAAIRQMNVPPVGRRQLVQVAAIAGLPLAFLVLPVAEVLRLLLGVIARNRLHGKFCNLSGRALI